VDTDTINIGMNGSTLIDMNVITHPSAFLQATFSVLSYFYIKEASKQSNSIMVSWELRMEPEENLFNSLNCYVTLMDYYEQQ